MENLFFASSSSLMRGRSLCVAQSGCGGRSPPARICSSLSASAGFAPEQPRGQQPTGSSCWKALKLHHPREHGHSLEGQFSSLRSGHSPWCSQTSCGHRCPTAGICSGPALCPCPPRPAPCPAKRAVQSSCPLLLKGPESVGNPQKFWEGTFHWRAAKAKGPKAHK